MFEATYELNCQLPLDLKPKPERLREIPGGVAHGSPGSTLPKP